MVPKHEAKSQKGCLGIGNLPVDSNASAKP